MLDTETKRRIDTCRDILVGKVPDPKSQVEQITIALIYKFMDDMDAEAEELGGKRAFFAGDFAKYGWAKLMAPNLGGYDVLNLYSEAIGKMNENPGVPALFRDIFKNAYLPYRDPETLRSFLKEINGFTYDHSERLGDAFEYLLSVLGSQGDAGQFRTPRHIIDFMVALIDPQKDETILDPACGTAGFLISAYKHILNANRRERPGDALTPDERKRLAGNFHGYDISPDMVRLSLVNLYLHGFANPRIEEYDTLTSEDRWHQYADVILANPPFMSPKGGIKPHKRFSIQANRSEVLFVDYIAEHLTSQGRAAVVVPEGIIFQSGTAYKQLRKLLVEGYLVAVISLPAGVFNPYSGVKTSILLMDRRLAKKSDAILFAKVENDGFGLGAQRRAIEKNDLPVVLQQIKAWLSCVNVGGEFDTTHSFNLHIVEKAKIQENNEYNLSGERYKDFFVNLSKYPLATLGDLCEIVRGSSPRPAGDKRYYGGAIPRLMVADVTRDGMYVTPQIDFLTEEGAKLSRPMDKGDLVMAVSGQPGLCSILKVDACIHDGFAGFKKLDKNKVLTEFAYYCLMGLRDHHNSQSVGAVFQNLKTEQLREFQIPLPPLAVQQEIVAEIEGYQQIIDGARQVVEHYRPRIAIDPAWPVVPFETAPFEIIDGDRGVNYPAKEEFFQEEHCLFLSTKNVRPNGFVFDEIMFISKQKDELLRKGKLDRGDVVLTTRGTVGNTAIYDEKVPYEHIRINSGMLIFRPEKEKLIGEYLFYFFQSENFDQQIKRIISGSAQPQLPIKSLNSAEIPLPDLATQRAIVTEIDEEQRMVAANRALIDRFTAKIQRTINRVWEG